MEQYLKDKIKYYESKQDSSHYHNTIYELKQALGYYQTQVIPTQTKSKTKNNPKLKPIIQMEFNGTLKITNPNTLLHWINTGKFQTLINKGYTYNSGCGRFKIGKCTCNKCMKIIPK